MKTTSILINFRKNCKVFSFALVIMCMAFDGPATTAGNDDPKNNEALQPSPQAELTLQLTPYVYPNGFNVSCFGFQDGSINLTVIGGTPPYTYLWSTKEITEDINNLSATYYSVEVWDQYGNYNKADINLTEPEPGQNPEITSEVFEYSNGYNVSCYGCYNGSIDLIVTGGSGLYSYSWRDGPTTQDRFGLCGKGYEVVIRGISECNRDQEFTRGFELREPPDPISLSQDWTMYGNSNTTPGTQFLGTTDNKDFVFKTNNTERLRIGSGGAIGINTTPIATLTVGGNGSFSSHLQVQGSLMVGTYSPTDKFSVAGNGKITGNFNVDGNIKIGNITSTEKLAVAGSGKVTDDFTIGKKTIIEGSLRIDSLAGPGYKTDSISVKSLKLVYVDQYGNLSAPSNPWASDNPPGYDFVCGSGVSPWKLGGNVITDNYTDFIGTCNYWPFRIKTSGIERMRISADGKVGIGTLSPQKTLHVVGTSAFIGDVGIGILNPTQKLQVNNGNILISGTNNFTDPDDEAILYLGDPNHLIKSIRGKGVLIRTFDVANGIFLQQSTGNVGIGTSIPNYKLDVCGTIHSSEWIVESPWWDSKFNPGNKRMTWQEKLDFIATHKHLPEIESEKVIKDKGLHVAATMRGFVYNIEDNTLDIIDLYKENQIINEKIKVLEQENSVLKKLLYELESRIKQIELVKP